MTFVPPAHRLLGALTVLGAAVTLAGPANDGFVPPRDQRLLPIADRRWAAGAPPEGWCGEASVQMVALFSGAWVPQSAINALGRSTHVDLWEDDVPVALERLGLVAVPFTPTSGSPRAELLMWIVAQLRAGVPVIVGAKLMPTDHPTWDVDHLMPVVGFTPTHLVFNTNTEAGQVHVSFEALRGQPATGISFASPSGRLRAFAVTGFRDAPRPAPALTVVDEREGIVTLAVGPGAGLVLVLEQRLLDGGVLQRPATRRVNVDAREWLRVREATAPITPASTARDGGSPPAVR